MINLINYHLAKKLEKATKLPIYVNSVEQNIKVPCLFIFNRESKANNYGGITFSTTHLIDIIYKTDNIIEQEQTNNIYDIIRENLDKIEIEGNVYFITEEGTFLEKEDRHFFININIPNRELKTSDITDSFYKAIVLKVKELSGLETFYVNGVLNEENLENGFFVLRPIEELIESSSVIGNKKYTRVFELVLVEKLETRDTYGFLSGFANKLFDVRYTTDNTSVWVSQCKLIPDYKYVDDSELGTVATYKLETTIKEQ
ncbi:DUF6838 family protein [Streptobacillus moniliformis]|uniref:phage tail terminator family protein n=1 Tax=Streptobacillus moniliformis TaxID=34105 RepID=UPI0007E4C0FC|nr:hypothetical protein [Streptobacillus moniliformis]